MLVGSTQILGPVPARSLDPVLLALSQPPDMRGYVVISPRDRADLSDGGGGRAWDAIFLAGNAEPDCLRLTPTARTILPFTRVEQELRNAGREGRVVHLFEAPEKLLREFLWIARSDPVLKVNLGSLDVQQIETLLAGSPVRHGLLERSDCTGDLPCFELAGISTLVEGLGVPFTLPRLQLGYEKGGMTLFQLDPAIDRPASGARSRGAARVRDVPAQGVSVPEYDGGEHAIAPEFFLRSNDPDPGGGEEKEDRPAEGRRRTQAPDDQIHARADKARKAGKGVGGKGRSSRPSIPPASILTQDQTRHLSAHLTQRLRPDLTRDPSPNPSRSQTAVEPVRPRPPGSRDPTYPPEEPDDVVVIFQRLFRSFRKKGVDCLGGRWEDALRSAIEKVRFLAPEFQVDSLTPLTAPLVPDLILELIRAASFLKRSRLREAALLLIADIYDKHFDLLEARGLVDRVEQAYLRLKQ